MALTKITSNVIEPGSIAHSSLADSGVTGGTHGHAAGIPVLEISSKGVITGVNVVDVAGVSNVTYNNVTGVLTVSTSDGSNFNVDLSVGSQDSLELTSLSASGSITADKILYSNVYSTEGELPDAATYHGMFAHVHGTGKGYFSHSSAWHKLIDETSSDTDDLSEGSTNQYFTTARARASVSATGSLSYNQSTGVFSFTQGNTDTVAEGSTNLYYTDTRVRSVLTADSIANQTYVDQAEADAISTAAADATSKANAALASANSYTDAEVAALVDSSPATLDTLNELAAALGDDPNFATTTATNIGTKVDKINITGATVGSGTSIPVITYNSQGQITSTTTAAIPPITKATIDALNVDADTLDGLNSTQFLRSDTNSTFTGNQLKLENSFPSSGGLLLVSDDGTATTVSSGTAFRVTNNGGSGSYSVFESSSGLSDLVHYNDGVLVMSNSSGAPILRLEAPASELARIELGDGSNYTHISSRPDMGDGLMFYENGAVNTVMRGGNVGIGATSPTKKLDIRGGDVTIYGGVDGYNADSEEVRLWLGNNNAHIGAMFNYGLFFDPGNGAGKALMIRQSNGYVGINDITPSYHLDVNGTIRATGEVIADSDIRLKSNINTITNAVDTVKSLRGTSYIKDDKPNIGLIAQEVEEVMPFMVSTASDEMGTKSVNYQNMVALLIEAMKEQQEQIDELKKMLEVK